MEPLELYEFLANPFIKKIRQHGQVSVAVFDDMTVITPVANEVVEIEDSQPGERKTP